MIAVAILALVSFGIFQAFATGFQTLNDAKDRTMASNYAQQILEDYKNTHFEKIVSFTDSLEGTKFTQNVSVQPVGVNENLKNVVVQINWLDRNNNSKNVNVSTVIYDTQTTAVADSTPAGISIYATPYNLLPGTYDGAKPSLITAEIVDANGDLITDWDESDVDFSIEAVVNLKNVTQDSSYLGSIDPTSDGIDQGVAQTTFSQYTTSEREGYVQIKASLTIDGDEIYDTLTLKVTNDAVAVVLTSNKEIISTEGGEEGTANLTATIVDAIGDTVVTDREIDINIISGPGSLANFTDAVDGVAYIDLMAGNTAGVSTIMATSNLLEPSSVSVEIVDPGAYEISVEADDDVDGDQTIVQEGTATITAYLTDYLGDGISGETIQFSTDIGVLNPTSGTTGEDGSETVTLTMNYAGTATITASWTAVDESVISDTVEVLCRNHNLYVYAGDNQIIAGNSTAISVELTDADTTPLDNKTINFAIAIDSIGSLSSFTAETDALGIASVTLTIGTPGTATVEANWDGDPTVVAGEVEVICISEPTYAVELSTGSTTISIGDTPTITATVTENGSPVGSGTEITFSLDNYTNAKLNNQPSQVTVPTTDESGIISVTLSGLIAGETVTVTATVDTATDSMTITCATPTISIALADPANISYGPQQGSGKYYYVYFDIIINGGSIDLSKMKISWASDGNDNEKLEILYINDSKVYDNSSGAGNGTIITFNQVTSYTLTNGSSYTIKMEFKQKVQDKDWSITFTNPVSGEEMTNPVTFLSTDF